MALAAMGHDDPELEALLALVDERIVGNSWNED